MPQITRLSAPAFPLVDTATLQQWLRLDAGTDSATLSLLLASASDYLEGLTGRVLASATYNIVLDDPCQPIPLTPVNNVMSVAARLTDGTTQFLALGTDYLLLMSGSSSQVQLINPIANLMSLSLMCSAGYATITAVPAVLQQAAAVLVSAGYDNRNALDPRTISTVSNLVQRYRAVGL